MLDDYRRLYEHNADALITELDWRKENKNNLFYKCIEYEISNPRLSEAYIASIMVRYWRLVNSYYAKGKGAYTAEEVHDWLLDVVCKALKERPWVPGSGNRLENDPNGPDKYVNVCMLSRRQGFYQWSNAGKRASSFTQNYSLEKMLEDAGDSKLPFETNIKNLDFNMDLKNWVIKEFKSKNYMSSFLIDGIVNTSVIDWVETENGLYTQFNKKKLSKHIRHYDPKYCDTFSKIYELPKNEVESAMQECAQLSSTKIYTILKNVLNKISKESFLKQN